MDDNTVRHKWNRYAARYDRDIGLFEKIQFGGGRAWVRSRATGDVLEVAIGTGLNLPHYPPGIRLTGLDFSPAMLDQARARAAEHGLDVRLQVGDAQALPLRDATFDTVVCTLGPCGVPDDRAAPAEMHRVLRPGGTLLLLDHIGSHHNLLHLGQRLLDKLTVRTLGDHQTRRPLQHLATLGFQVRHTERFKWAPSNASPRSRRRDLRSRSYPLLVPGQTSAGRRNVGVMLRGLGYPTVRRERPEKSGCPG
ncbi:class I SAM-dependent methyltransferase [Saccharothrix sp.]|uniref:class I SAM-dependent methyltransferase n=1 Tax=Saccharothrix sp. TaxID=1873460 RepID=UPI002812521F|nr:class I SAM-dependent methyltransferase [Saccharothrix sp.]